MAGFWLVQYLFIDRRYSIWSRGLRTLGFALVILVPSAVKPNVSYRTHGIGFVVGSFFGLGYFFKNKKRIRSYERVEYEEAIPSDGPPIIWN